MRKPHEWPSLFAKCLVSLFSLFPVFHTAYGQPTAPSATSGNNTPPGKPDTASPHQLHFLLMQAVDQLEPYRPLEKLEGTIEFGGSITMLDLGKRWAQNFKQFHPPVDFRGATEGSEVALKALAENPLLIAGISRPVDESDLKLLQSGKCKEPVAITIGIEALALCVHKDNPLQSVSQETFINIFAASQDGSSKAKTWGDLGVTGNLASEAIVRYERDSGSGTQSFLTRILLGGAKTAPAAKQCSSNTEVCDLIAKDPKGVGLSDINYSNPSIRRVPLMVDNRAVIANEENVLAGQYPLVRPLVLVFDKAQANTDGKLRESIVRYVLSREGQTAVMKSGFYPIDPGLANHQIAEVFGQQLR